MVQLTTILILIPLILLIACFVYIAIIGRIGIQMFKYNMPFLRRRGTWYLIRMKDGRWRIVYDKFKTQWNWADGSTCIIRRKFDKIHQTAEPLVFLEEGGIINKIFGEVMPKEEQSKHIVNLIRFEKANERLKAQEQYKSVDQSWLRHLPLITAVLSLLAVILLVALFMNLAEVSQFIDWVQPKINEGLEVLSNMKPTQI